MTQVQGTEFPQFSQLAPEIRRMIWDRVVEEPHVVETRGFYNRYAEGYSWWSDGYRVHVFPKFPPVHDVCHEARRAFLESPGLVSEKTGLGVAWHPERDILMCHDIRASGDESGRGLSWWENTEHLNEDGSDRFPGRDHVQHIMFDLATFHKAYQLRNKWGGAFTHPRDVEYDIEDHFPNIKTMELVVGDEFKSLEEPASMEITLQYRQGPLAFYRLWDLINMLRCDELQPFSVRILGRMTCRLDFPSFGPPLIEY